MLHRAYAASSSSGVKPTSAGQGAEGRNPGPVSKTRVPAQTHFGDATHVARQEDANAKTQDIRVRVAGQDIRATGQDIRVAGNVIHVAGQVICVSGIRVRAYAYSYAGTQQQRRQRRRTSQRPGFYGNGKQLQETPHSRG